MDAQLRAALIAANAGRPLHYSGDRAIPTHCTHCGAVTLAGWDHPRVARFRTVDPTPLTPTLEAACWLTLERYTVELTGTPGYWRFGAYRTTPGFITLHLSNPRGPVVPEHKCGQRLGADTLELNPTRIRYPDNPPF